MIGHTSLQSPQNNPYCHAGYIHLLYYSVMMKCDVTISTVTLCHREGEEKIQWEKGTEHTGGKVDTSYYHTCMDSTVHIMLWFMVLIGFFSVLFCIRFFKALGRLVGVKHLAKLDTSMDSCSLTGSDWKRVKPWCSLCFSFSPLWLLFVFIPKFLQFFFNISSMTAGIWRNNFFEMLCWNNLFWGETYHTLRKKQDYESFFH